MEGTIIDTMSTEITEVLKKNLYALLNPILEEQTKTNDALLNFPIAQKLQDKIKQLEQKLLETNCQKNIKIFELKQEIKNQNEKIQSLEKQLNGICSIKLEVKEIEKSQKENVDIDLMNDSNSKNEKIDTKPVALTSNMWNLLDNSDEEYQYSGEENEDEENEDEENEENEEEDESEKEEENAENEEENLIIDSEDELELEEIVINEIKYLTDNKINGTIYKCDDEGEIIEDEEGDLIIVGKFNNNKSELYFD